MNMHEHSHDTSADMLKPKRSLVDFLPLIVIFGAVIILTLTTLLLKSTIVLQEIPQYFMGYFFLVFGGFKVVKLRGFADAYSVYDVIAMRVRAYGFVYPFIELGLGVMYLLGVYLVYANLITLIIMLVGAWGVFLKLRQKEEIPCACLGVVFKIPMTYVTLIEDLLMAGMAAWMLCLMLL